MTKLLFINKTPLQCILVLLLLFGCKDSTTEQSIQDCIVEDNYMCLANIAYVLELDWGNGELWSLPKYMTLGTHEDCIEIEDLPSLYIIQYLLYHEIEIFLNVCHQFVLKNSFYDLF